MSKSQGPNIRSNQKALTWGFKKKVQTEGPNEPSWQKILTQGSKQKVLRECPSVSFRRYQQKVLQKVLINVSSRWSQTEGPRQMVLAAGLSFRMFVIQTFQPYIHKNQSKSVRVICCDNRSFVLFFGVFGHPSSSEYSWSPVLVLRRRDALLPYFPSSVASAHGRYFFVVPHLEGVMVSVMKISAWLVVGIVVGVVEVAGAEGVGGLGGARGVGGVGGVGGVEA